jgi:type III secretion protein L
MGQFAFISDADLKIAPGTRVVKAGEYASYIEAGRVLAEARAKALDILAAAERKAGEMREAGFAEGLRQGKESSSKYMLGILSKSRDHLEESEERIIALVISVLKKILGDMDEKEVVVRMVRSAMVVVSRQNQVTVMVAPEKVDTVKASLHRILQPYPRINSVEVVGDPKLTGGDCVLETKLGRVEASLESQLKTITGALSDLAPNRKERLERDLKAIELELSSGLLEG